MPAENVKPGLRLALKLHEIGDATPYKLFFAGKGKSGASFGFMQGDLAAGQRQVTKTFERAMAAAGIAAAAVETYVDRLSVHLIRNPLDANETQEVNGALLASRNLVDEMDEGILQDVYGDLDVCIAKAADAGRKIEPKALIYMALWINMSGHPDKLLVWLDGGNPKLQAPLPKLGKTVDANAVEGYLRATSYYTENPGNFPHLLHCAAAGAAAIGSNADTAPVEASSTGRTRAALIEKAATELGANAGAGSGRAASDTGHDADEFAGHEIEGTFTTNTSWLSKPLQPAFLEQFLDETPLDDFDFAAFVRHIDDLGLKHFKAIELLYLGASNAAGRCKRTNRLPPRSLWKNIDNTARMLDEIRDRLGAPIRILSAYRAPDYNSCIGGEKASQHMKFNAIDWQCDAGTVKDWHRAATELRAERREFLGGIGFYPSKGFIHIDTRGREADWTGS